MWIGWMRDKRWIEQLGDCLRRSSFGLSFAVASVLCAGAISTGSTAQAAWSIESSPNLTGSSETVLHGVSCTSSSACVAVGFAKTSSNTVPVAETLSGGEWKLSVLPLPSGATTGSLEDVSCWSEVGCAAVGSYVDSSRESQTLAEHWNGSEWSIQTTGSAGGTWLLGVSCNSSKACMAVGEQSVSGAVRTLAERWNGKTWTVLSTPSPSTLDDLAMVSCASSKACTAVGSASGNLAERWNGVEWSVQETPGGTGASLRGVSCATAKLCEAVGNEGLGLFGGPYVSTALGWSVGVWSAQTPAGGTGEAESRLRGISCPESKGCVAVGSWNAGAGEKTFANFWNGTGWAFETTPNPTGAASSELDKVSCVTASRCIAVGSSRNSEFLFTTLIEAKG